MEANLRLLQSIKKINDKILDNEKKQIDLEKEQQEFEITQKEIKNEIKDILKSCEELDKKQEDESADSSNEHAEAPETLFPEENGEETIGNTLENTTANQDNEALNESTECQDEISEKDQVGTRQNEDTGIELPSISFDDE